MRRTFIAVDITPGEKLLSTVAIIRKKLANENIKWTDTGNMHLTLAFLGDTEEETLRKIAEGLPKITAGAEAPHFTVTGLGLFPGINNPRVLWAGIKDHQSLTYLQKRISDFLHTLYINTEEREFKPHLTIGRIKYLKNTSNLNNLMTGFRDTVFQDVQVKEVIYYESILKPEGPQYKPVAVAVI